MTRSAHTAKDDAPADRKSVLFCPVCEHESHVDGDWRLHERARSVEYRCPNCDDRITERERRPLVRA